MTDSLFTIVSFATQNPERQAELRAGIARLMRGREFRLIFAEDEAAACKSLREAQVLLGWQLTPPMLECAPQLRWVHLGIAGVEKSLIPALVESDIVLTNARGIHAPVMAEWALAVLFQISQRMSEAETWRRDRKWKPHKDDMTRTRFVLTGRRALIIGLGAIGQEIAKKLAGIGVECEGVAAHLRPSDIPLHLTEELPAIIGGFDIVVIAVPYTPATDKLINRDLLQRMKPDSILVNLARGKVIEEQAMIECLKNGPLGFAALDVFETEPLPEDSPLFDLPNVVMTPHIAGNFPDYTKKVNEGFLRNLEKYLAGEPLENVVDKRRGY
jgi:phosphoglycerate dehydrogenase-like enzyme